MFIITQLLIKKDSQGIHVVEKIINGFDENLIPHIYELLINNFLVLSSHSNAIGVVSYIITLD